MRDIPGVLWRCASVSTSNHRAVRCLGMDASPLESGNLQAANYVTLCVYPHIVATSGLSSAMLRRCIHVGSAVPSQGRFASWPSSSHEWQNLVFILQNITTIHF
ncbi:hypothetical protein K437DRAFT_111750 [Tilletiaria anomala UBC 951]|uniref:Uncharacterized protein n=1 Tax=Tilletiaria anomala (strain ATCC 24038 / CBS 436.72 / UBC 951) TaxID=1037660 RepID=A0A066W4E7_TILAU|nr:uncharacterized protein K437DRAFT_111750 [Tilletiaria anomala UBC 951]KDN45939.1 hypothetical protein K437DRAFT_111750 [Tilletiaria anomala UBC 951]